MTTVAIVKWEGGKNGDPVLFFPEYAANRGSIMCYGHIGQHSEASMGYYASLRNPEGSEQERAAYALISEYNHGLPGGEVLSMRARDNAKYRRTRWKGSL